MREGTVKENWSDAGANVKASGTITVDAKLESRPDLSSVAKSTNSNLPDEKDPSKATKVADQGIAGGVVVGVITNKTTAIISGDAQVNAAGAITVRANTLNQIDPNTLWGANLITPLAQSQKPDHVNTEVGLTPVFKDQIVELTRIGFQGCRFDRVSDPFRPDAPPPATLLLPLLTDHR